MIIKFKKNSMTSHEVISLMKNNPDLIKKTHIVSILKYINKI